MSQNVQGEAPMRILLVEESLGDTRLIRESLSEVQGFAVETAATLAEAVCRCERPDIDAVLLDLCLSDSVGLEALKTMRAVVPNVPVVILAGLADETAAVQAVRAGAQDYLIKSDLNGALLSRALRYAVTRKRAEVYREIGLQALRTLNEPLAFQDAMGRVLSELRSRTGFDAVGIRLQDGEDYPYFIQEGFSEEFLQTEGTLLRRAADGAVIRDADGRASLACLCGLVISGSPDPCRALFTRGGSFWTTDAARVHELLPEQGLHLELRNCCVQHGYASIALIPISNKEANIGLIQLCDRRTGCFTVETVELLEGVASHIGSALARKKMEGALRERESYIRAVIDNLPIGIAVNSVGGSVKFSYMNDNFPKFYRTTRAALTSEDSFWDVVYEDPAFRKEIRERVLSDCAKGDPSAMRWTEIPIIRAGEETTYISAMNTPIPGKSLMISAVWDVTERKRIEEDLLKMRKLQSVGTLAGGIAHDFNNILTGLFGNISLAMAELKSDDPAHVLLAEAEVSLSRAVRLTKQLLTFAKGGDPVKEDLHLGRLVEEVARFDLSGSNVRLLFRQAADLWPVEADKGQIQQVISNLVINARQAMPNGGCLAIELENVSLPVAAVAGLPPGKYVRVVVCDEGTGIAPKVLERLFEPYFTTKHTGCGLGLATVYSIISRHGGHIGVTSELGRHTTFTFYLPASSPKRQAEEPLPRADIQVSPRPAKILVMDDDEMICGLACRMLARNGYLTATASNGQQALTLYRLAKEQGAPFDAVLLDLTVPGGLGGKEIIKDLLLLDPCVKAVVSSGYADDPVLANYFDYGFKDVVAKPYTLRELCEVFRRVLQ